MRILLREDAAAPAGVPTSLVGFIGTAVNAIGSVLGSTDRTPAGIYVQTSAGNCRLQPADAGRVFQLSQVIESLKNSTQAAFITIREQAKAERAQIFQKYINNPALCDTTYSGGSAAGSGAGKGFNFDQLPVIPFVGNPASDDYTPSQHKTNFNLTYGLAAVLALKYFKVI